MAVVGLLGRKLGMTSLWDEKGRQVSVTEIEAGPCTVVQVKTPSVDGYEALQIGFLPRKRKHTTKPLRGHFKKADLEPFRHLREIRSVDTSSVARGATLTCEIFAKGDRLMVTGVSKGKGFQGVVRRHHFAGGPKTHGESDRVRAPGSVGSSSRPSRTWPGKQMAGRMGGDRISIRNLEVVSIDPAKNRLFLKGAVPGARESLLILRKPI